MRLTLSAYSVEHAGEIAKCLLSADEARAWAGDATTLPITAEQFRRWHRDPEVHPFVGINGRDLVVGYGELWVDEAEQEIELARILVHPAHRGVGLGHALVESLVARAAGFELEDLFIRVLPDNLAAIRCYQAAGFVPVPMEDQQRYNREQPRHYLWLEHAT